MLMLRRSMLFASAMAFALIATACGDGNGGSSETKGAGVVSGDDVVFGSGELPATVPANFPLPAGSSIGSTMVVTSTGFTEIVARVNAERSPTAEFFDRALEQAGFTVGSSSAQDRIWLIEFSYDGAKGTIEISEPTQGISQAVIRYNVP